MEVHGHAVRGEAGQLLRIQGATQDITGRHRTADALQASQELLRMAERVAEIGSFETDDRTGVMTWSNNMHRLFERNSLEFDHGHAEGIEMIHADDRDRFLRMRVRVLEEGLSETIQHRYYRGDEVRWSETRLEPLLEGGITVGVRGTLQDITSRRRDEEEIRLQAHLLDVVDAAVIATDLEGVITHWNSRAEQLYGWTQEETVERPLLTFNIDAADDSTSRDAAAAIEAAGTWRGEYHVRHKDGTVFPALVQTSVYRDDVGEPAGLIGTSMDLTERVDMEARLRAGRDYMQAVTDSIGEGMYTLDEDGRLLYMNPAAEAMLGWKLGELEGKVLHHAIHYRHADGSDFPIEACPISGARMRRETVRVDDDIYIAKDGSEVPVEYTAAPIETDEGVLGAVVVFSDITDAARKPAGDRSADRFALLDRADP